MRTLLIAFVVLLVTAVAGVLIGPSFVDWNRYKEPITEQLSAVVGRSVAVDGAVSFAMLPSPRLTADGIRIGNGPGAVSTEAVAIDRLDLEVGLWPLLSGRVVVRSANLSQPVVTLERDAVGQALWPMGPQNPDVNAAIALEQVTITDGILIWDDRSQNRQWRLQEISGQVRAESLRGPLDLIGSFVVADRLVTVQASMARATSSGAWPMTVEVTPDGSNAEAVFSGIVDAQGRAQGDITLETPSLAATLDRLFPELGLLGALDRPTVVNALFDGTFDTVRLNGGQITFGDTRGTGALGIAIPAADREPVVADIALSLNRMELPAPDPRGPGLAALFGEAIQRMGTADWTVPAGWDATIELDVDAVGLAGGLIRQVGIGTRMQEGAVEVTRLEAQLPGATDLTANGAIALSTAPPAIDARVSVASGDLRALLEWVGVSVDGVPPARLRSLQGSATIRGGVDDFQVLGVDGTLDNTRFTGGLAFRDQGRPGVGLRLDVGSIDLDAYRPTAGASPPTGPVIPRWLGELTTVGPWVTGVDANLAVTADTLTIDGVTLRDLVIDATLAEGQLVVRNLAAASLLDAAFAVSGSMGSVSPPANFDMTVSIDTDDPERLLNSLAPALSERLGALAPVDLDTRVIGGVDQVRVEARGSVAGGEVELAGDVLAPAGRPFFDLTARLSHPDTQALLARITPAYRPAGPLGDLDVFFGARGRAGDLEISGIQGRVGGVDVAGDITFAQASGVPADVRTQISVGTVTLEPWLPVTGRGEDRPADRPGERWSSRPFATGVLPGAQGRIDLAAREIVIGTTRLGDVALAAAFAPDQWLIEGVSGTLFDGVFGLSGEVGGTDVPDQLAIVIDADLVGARAAETLAALAGVERGIDGTMDLALNATMRGSSPAALVGRVTGEGLLSVREGTVAGLDLGGVDEALKLVSSPSDFMRVLNGPMTEGDMRFDTLNAPFTVREGQLQTEQLRLVAEAGFGEGQASLDLRRRLLDLAMNFSLYAQPQLPPFTVRLTGDPALPQRRVQTQQLQTFLTQQRLGPSPALEAPSSDTLPQGDSPLLPLPDAASDEILEDSEGHQDNGEAVPPAFAPRPTAPQ